MKSVVIVPSNREQQITHFLEVWRKEMANATVMIIEDNPDATSAVGASGAWSITAPGIGTRIESLSGIEEYHLREFSSAEEQRAQR